MGETTTKLRQVAEDLKNSWYFRFWLLSSVVLFVVGFAALIILGARGTNAKKNPDTMLWFEMAEKMNYPQFHFRAKNGMNILSVNCTHFLQQIETGLCQPFHGYVPGIEECQAVYASSIEIINSKDHEFFDMGIGCNITTTGNNSEVGNLIAFEFEGGDQVIGPDAVTALWLQPTDHAWILLQKAITKVNKKTSINDWTRKLVYQSTVSIPGNYHVRVIIEDFGIFHIDTQDLYSGWRAFADIGGFAFALVLFQTLFMIIIGLCFHNSSTFLKGDENHTGSHHNIPSSAEYQVINNK